MEPASKVPRMAARCDPAASMTARRSSILVSSVGIWATRSDSPVPRRSKVIRRENDASRS
jgi:hypothetical protein